MFTRRSFLSTSAATVGGITILPFAAQADGHGMTFGDVAVHPVGHASVILETPMGVIYADPVGEVSAYADKPKADLVLVTHEHGDHLSNDVLAAVVGDAPLVTNAGAHAKMSGDFAAGAKIMGNGESDKVADIAIDAIPAHNLTADRMKFHPQGRDNGYVLTIGDTRIYLSGDTEDVPEMRGLKDIDLAFVCMNLPFTMDVAAAASAVNEFKPGVVIPYHYRGRDGGTQDPLAFAKMLEDGIRAEQGDWYGKGPGMV